MKLWLLEKIEPGFAGKYWSYDCYYAHVVRAETEEQARNMVPCGDEGKQAWLDLSLTTCAELTADGEPGVIISDFSAG